MTITQVGFIGSGHAAKALNNLVSAATMSITVEALVLAEAFGISADTMTTRRCTPCWERRSVNPRLVGRDE